MNNFSKIPKSKSIEQVISIPRVELVKWPTPLEEIRHPRLGRLLIKRDDLSGFGLSGRSGVKGRKLEPLFAHLKARHIKQLVMPLGNITNLGWDLIATAKDLGVSIKLLIVDDPPMPLAQREKIFAPLKGHVELLGRSYVFAASRLLMAKIASIQRRTKSMISLPSPAHPTAMIGAARGFIEAMEQSLTQHGALPRAVYVASAAGSTVAGFALAEALLRKAGAPPVQVCAVQVVPQPLGLWIPILARWTAHYHKLTPINDFNTLSIAREEYNIKYGHFDHDHLELCHRIKCEYDIQLDPIYGGKSFRTLEQRETQNMNNDRPVLFWHCGYTSNWQAYQVNP